MASLGANKVFQQSRLMRIRDFGILTCKNDTMLKKKLSLNFV